MNKTERAELRSLIKARFKLLKTDVRAREAELNAELEAQVEAEFAAGDKAYDDLMFQVKQALDEANRKVNDIGRQLWGIDKWGATHDRQLVVMSRSLERPGLSERRTRTNAGRLEIERRVAAALLELDRRENRLLTELAEAALESVEAKQFLKSIPDAASLVPAYRMQEIADGPRS